MHEKPVSFYASALPSGHCLMKIEAQLIPVDAITREERVSNLRRLLMQGAVHLASLNRGLKIEEQQAPHLSKKCGACDE